MIRRYFTFYRRRDYKRQRTRTVSTFVSGPYTPLFSGCHTILRRRLEEDSDSDSQSDSDDKSEFDDPESWPDIFDDIDSDGNSEVEKDEITAEDEAASVANFDTNIETVTSDVRENDIIVTEEQEVIDDDDNGGSVVTNVNVNMNVNANANTNTPRQSIMTTTHGVVSSPPLSRRQYHQQQQQQRRRSSSSSVAAAIKLNISVSSPSSAAAPTAPPDVTVPSPPAFTSASPRTPSATTRSKQPTTITTTRRTDPIPPPSQVSVGQLGARSDVPTTPGPKITTTPGAPTKESTSMNLRTTRNTVRTHITFDDDYDNDDDDTCDHADDFDDDGDDDDYDDGDYEDTVEEANNDDDPLVVSEEDAEFDDNDGATDVDVEEDLSPSCKLFYGQFIQSLSGERIARDLVKPFLPQIFELICKHHRFFDITGKTVTSGIVPPKITTTGGVYVTVEKETNADGFYTIKTVGSTSNFKKRLEYKIKDNLIDSHDEFIPICTIDMWPKELRDDFNLLYIDLMKQLKTHDSLLQPLQRQYFQMIDDHGGDRLGFKKCFWRMLVEHTIKNHYKVGQEMEFVMYNRDIEGGCYRYAKDEAESIFAAVPHALITAMRANPTEGDVGAIGSWKPGHNRISTQIETTNCIVGDRNKIEDTLPFATHPDAETAELVNSEFKCRADMIFDTTGYTRRQKASARKHRLVGRLKQFLTKPWGIIWIDFNKLILDDDNASDYRSIFEVLELLGFHEVRNINHGDSFMYIHRDRFHVAFPHAPFGIAGDSRTFISSELKVKRSLTAAIHTNVSLMLFSQNDNDDPVAVLSPTTKFCNPISAVLMSQMTKIGAHQGRFTVAAVFKYIVRPEDPDDSTNALHQNRLQKAPIEDEVCNNLRRARKNGRDPRRPVDRLVVSQGHCVISGSTDLVLAHRTILKLFASGPPKSRSKMNRFQQLLLKNRYIQKDSQLYRDLWEVRSRPGVMKNPGNRNDYVHKEGGMKDNRCLLERMNDAIAERQKYWIRAECTKSITEENLALPQSVLAQYLYEVIQPKHYVLAGLRTALEKKPIVNPNTKHEKQFTMSVPMYPYKEIKCFVDPTNPTMFKLTTPKGHKPKDFKSTPGATFYLCTIAPIID